MEHPQEHTDYAHSPQLYARIGGVLYLIIIAIGLSGVAFVRDRLIVSGDASATAERILASESLWRASIASELFMLACAVALALIFYLLVRPVNRGLALLVVLFNLTSITLEAGNKLQLLAALFRLKNEAYLVAFSPEQRYASASLSIQLHEFGYAVNLIFFGCAILTLGYLIFRSGYLPRAIGVLLIIAGAAYLTNSFSMILSPALAGRLFPVIMIPVFVGETSLAAWLLLRGVNVSSWRARASSEAVSGALPAAQA